MSTGYLLVDGNSIGFAAQGSTKLSAGDNETQAIFGTLRTIRLIVERFQQLTPIVLWDGVSWRKKICPEYKANRDKEVKSATDKKMADLRASYKKQRPHIARALKHLAVPQMAALNMEADDIAGMLVRRYRPQNNGLVLVTADKDWLQLIGPRTVWFDPIHDRKVTLGNFREHTGVANVRQFLELKALTGDSSDNLCGVGGIGEKGAKELIETYGSVQGFLNACLDGSCDVAGLPKKFRDFQDEKLPGRGIFARNIQLMNLIDPPPVVVNQPALTKGAFDPDAFRAICEEFLFRSITRDFATWLEPFSRRLTPAPAAA